MLRYLWMLSSLFSLFQHISKLFFIHYNYLGKLIIEKCYFPKIYFYRKRKIEIRNKKLVII